MLSKFRNYSPQSYNIVGVPDNIFTPTATQEYPIGARLRYRNWTFHYAYAGGTELAAGKLVYSTDTPAEANVTVGTAAAIGATEVPNITTTAAEANLDNGVMIVNDVAGEGHTYAIKRSAANADTATSTDVWLYDPLRVALTTSSQVELYSNFFYDIDIATDVNNLVAGVPMMVVTANYYFWLTTWGPVSCLSGATTVAGEPIIPHATDGSVGPATAVTEQMTIGRALTGGTDTEYNGIHLMLWP